MKMLKRLRERIRRRVGATFVGVPVHQVPRSVQLDDYSCVAHAVRSVLAHVGVPVPRTRHLKYLLGTNEDTGTDDAAVITYLRMRGVRAYAEPSLPVKKLRELLARGHLVLCDVDGDHVALVHGMDRNDVHLADPSVVRCPGRSQPLTDFRERFGRSGIVVQVR